MRKKENLVCLIVVISAVLIALGIIILGMIQREKKATSDGAWGSEINRTAESSLFSDLDDSTIPPIVPSDKEHTNQESGGVNVDVSDMTRNPDAEVISSWIEYGTRERNENE